MSIFNLTENTTAADLHAEQMDQANSIYNRAREEIDQAFDFNSEHLEGIINVLRDTDHPPENISISSHKRDITITFNYAKSPKIATSIMSHLIEEHDWEPGAGVDSSRTDLEASRQFHGFVKHPLSLEDSVAGEDPEQLYSYHWVTVRINLHYESHEEMDNSGCRIVFTGEMSEPRPIYKVHCD